MLAAPSPQKSSDKSTQKIAFSYAMVVSRISLIYQLFFFFFCLPFCSCKWFMACACTFDLLVKALDLTVKTHENKFHAQNAHAVEQETRLKHL